MNAKYITHCTIPLLTSSKISNKLAVQRYYRDVMYTRPHLFLLLVRQDLAQCRPLNARRRGFFSVEYVPYYVEAVCRIRSVYVPMVSDGCITYQSLGKGH